MENTLSRDGTTPNVMNADIDLNSNDLLNVALLDADAIKVGGVTVGVSNGYLTGPQGPQGAQGPQGTQGPQGPIGVSLQIVKAVRTTDLTPTNNVWTAIAFDAELFDDFAGHSTSTNTSRLVVPSGYTRARLTSNVVWNANSTGFRYSAIEKNRNGVIGTADTIGSTQMIVTSENSSYINSGWITVTAGDYFELFAMTTTTATIRGPGNTAYGGRTWFQMELLP